MGLVARVVAVTVSLLAGAACSEASDGELVGNWRGTSSAGVAVQLSVERETHGHGSVAGLEGVMMISDVRCLRSAPFAGTLTQDLLEISASGTGTVSASTFADVTGVVEATDSRAPSNLVATGNWKLAISVAVRSR
jgi:hypothetical protein